MKKFALCLLAGSVAFLSCENEVKKPEQNQPLIRENRSSIVQPDWARNAVIYEVNLRQFTPEGTFEAFRAHLPRLKELGADILWLMPINPVGKQNRKGNLGSYYSISDYTGINPEFGNEADFRRLMEEAHQMGFKVILDWVANHTAWDHPWIKEHPDWYTTDSTGKMKSPVDDWSDVADLNYDHPELREAMIHSMEYWVKNFEVDGFRCDVAMMVPTDFWNDCRKRLDSIKPVFMLAEAEEPEHHLAAFNMSYTWNFMHLMNDIAAGKKKPADIIRHFKLEDSLFGPDDLRMYFITNHDENSWNGTEFERYGAQWRNMAVLAYTIHGMPLIYSGQEALLNKRLRFFDKDTIAWGSFNGSPFYKGLLDIYKSNPALANGMAGGRFEVLKWSDHPAVFIYRRQKGNNEVLVMLNFGPGDVEITAQVEAENRFKTFFEPQSEVTLKAGDKIQIKANEFKLYYR